MKTIYGLVAGVALLLVLSLVLPAMAALQEYYPMETATGKLMTPTSSLGGPWFADDKGPYFGTDKDAYIKWISASDYLKITGSTDTVYISLSAASTNGSILAPLSGNIKILGISEVHSVVATATGTLTIVKLSGTQAPATAGWTVMSNTFNLRGTVETSQAATLNTSSKATQVNTTERLGYRFNNPVTGLSGGTVAIWYKRLT